MSRVVGGIKQIRIGPATDFSVASLTAPVVPGNPGWSTIANLKTITKNDIAEDGTEFNDPESAAENNIAGEEQDVTLDIKGVVALWDVCSNATLTQLKTWSDSKTPLIMEITSRNGGFIWFMGADLGMTITLLPPVPAGRDKYLKFKLKWQANGSPSCPPYRYICGTETC